MKLIVVSGLSGAGKSVALHTLEDLNYYCIDNMPLSLLRTFTADVLQQEDLNFERLAVGIDARARDRGIRLVPERIGSLREAGIDLQVWFCEADNETILRRYSETRRKHPLTDARTPLIEAIEKERRLLVPIRSIADLLLDTSHSNVHQLRELIRSRMQGAEPGQLSILFQSFGYKNGVPDGVDFVFDVRCLPNPHWEPELRPLSGHDRPVRDYLESKPEVGQMHGDIRDFLERWLPRFQAENRAYVTVAIGCTGGRHRSVYFVERLAEHFRRKYPQVIVRHNELP
jgi:RNase adapter protein RapZ